jgi:hypothetical protein
MIRSAAALLAVPLLLSACDVERKHSGDSGDNVSIKADASGNVSFDVPFVKGQVKVPETMLHNGDIDIDGVKLMPGSKLTGFSVFAQDKGSKVDMAFTAPAAPEQVRAYYVDQFKAKGVEATLSGDAVSGKSKDGSPFTIQVSPSGSGSVGKIEIQSKD